MPEKTDGFVVMHVATDKDIPYLVYRASELKAAQDENRRPVSEEERRGLLRREPSELRR